MKIENNVIIMGDTLRDADCIRNAPDKPVTIIEGHLGDCAWSLRGTKYRPLIPGIDTPEGTT